MNKKIQAKIKNMQGIYKELTLQNIQRNICLHCGSTLPENFVLANSTRHVTSPNPSVCAFPFCNQEHANKWNDIKYAHLADLDRNASDSECFEHIEWVRSEFKNFDGTIFYGPKKRKGRRKITGEEVIVEPLQPSENSGQPKECTEHFELLERYKKYL